MDNITVLFCFVSEQSFEKAVRTKIRIRLPKTSLKTRFQWFKENGFKRLTIL